MRRLEGRSNHLYDRDGKFYFRRAVPVELQKELGRREWKRTLGCMSYMKPWEAERQAEKLTKQTDGDIRIARRTVNRLATDDEQSRLGFETALETDVIIRAAAEVGGLGELQSKFGDQTDVYRRFGTATERQVLLGEKPLSLIYEYAKERHPVKSEKHRELVVRHFVEIMGDLDVMRILRRDVLEFIDKYKQRGHSSGTLRRRLGALTTMVNHYYRDHDIQRNNPFEGSVKEAGPGHTAEDRLPLNDAQVEKLSDFLRTTNSMTDFNKAVFWLIITTGAGPAEVGGLAAEDIILDADIPHVWIRANDVRGLKAKSRERKCNPVSVGAALNKQLKNAVVLGEKQSVYSLRHWMADRLRFTGATEAEAKYILGHSRGSSHERYGSRHLNLDQLKALLLAVSETR
ncbi:MAG: DUF6538 domain-containing protein [Pseudomonadota bacterium]